MRQNTEPTRLLCLWVETSNTSPNGTGASCVARPVRVTRSVARLKTLTATSTAGLEIGTEWNGRALPALVRGTVQGSVTVASLPGAVPGTEASGSFAAWTSGGRTVGPMAWIRATTLR